MPLALVEVHEKLEPITPAAMYEREAAKYVKLDIQKFRKLVKDGKILARAHAGSSRRLYIKPDLDAFLLALKECPRDDLPKPTGRRFSRED